MSSIRRVSNQPENGVTRVLIIGGYGVFGGRLARALATDTRLQVLVAGRSRQKAQAFCRAHGGTAIELDLSDHAADVAIADLAVKIVVDAAGPYQSYMGSCSGTYTDEPYRVAKAAIACSAHYLDLSDDAMFTAQINCLDSAAREAGVVVLSGVSSVPALSAAIVADLAAEFATVELIESTILAGNQAPRGLSVIRSILTQVGRPVAMLRGARWMDVPGWSGLRTVSFETVGKEPLIDRWCSYIGAPDLQLFGPCFGARSVLFRAGLELKLMHGGLVLLGLLVRCNVLRNLPALAVALQWLANRLQSFGSDRGGMSVRVLGYNADGDRRENSWTLIAEDGEGPEIPTLPARIIVRKLLGGELEAGARPCLREFDRTEAETELATIASSTAMTQRAHHDLFEQALGEQFKQLPDALQRLHRVADREQWRGQASVERGTGLLSRFIGRLVGFPGPSEQVPVTVVMLRTEQDHGLAERWRRSFGSSHFVSHLSVTPGGANGRVIERFGVTTFELQLSMENSQLHFPVRRGWLLGVPLPQWLLPQSNTAESVDSEGRANFDVALSLPIAGLLVHYRGWLTQAF